MFIGHAFVPQFRRSCTVNLPPPNVLLLVITSHLWMPKRRPVNQKIWSSTTQEDLLLPSVVRRHSAPAALLVEKNFVISIILRFFAARTVFTV
jgi:hypothetical protein